ncbi:MAG TPA: hypothetical protein VK750_00390 [Cytophagaceae bacterium]|jgi:hypothetical protein|nr:hypothetical protein [Cytophagaceae bacterium]
MKKTAASREIKKDKSSHKKTSVINLVQDRSEEYEEYFNTRYGNKSDK